MSFKDVNKEHWSYRSIENLINKGIWRENSDIFQGKKEVTRYEFAKELNKFGFDTDLYITKIDGMEETLEVLKWQIKENQRVINELQERIDKLEKK